MIEADADHHGNRRIDHVDGIQAPAHADLEHPGIELRGLENQQRRQRVVFEKSQRYGGGRAQRAASILSNAPTSASSVTFAPHRRMRSR